MKTRGNPTGNGFFQFPLSCAHTNSTYATPEFDSVNRRVKLMAHVLVRPWKWQKGV